MAGTIQNGCMCVGNVLQTATLACNGNLVFIVNIAQGDDNGGCCIRAAESSDQYSIRPSVLLLYPSLCVCFSDNGIMGW